MRFFSYALFFLVLFSYSNNIQSQWLNDPTANLMICDLAGAQSLPKIVSTSDGGNYISWFDNRSGDYRVYMQRLDPFGYKLWAADGLLISANPQSSSLVDYSLICDADDNAVLIFSDTRNSGNLNVFAYKISPAGTFLWGNNGVDFLSPADFEANGKVVQTDDGGYVFAWIAAGSPNKTAVQKLSSAGAKLWGASPIMLQGSSGEGFNYPAVVKSDNNSVILLHTTTTGNFPAQTVKLRAQKLNSSGEKQWGVDGISIQNLGKIAAFSVPFVRSDGMNGGFISWHDDRDNNNLQSAFVQRVSSAGVLYFPVDGAEASLAPSRQKYNPVVSFDPVSANSYVFWMETEPSQNQNGIMGQKLSQSGQRLWGENAKVFKDLSAPSTISISNVKTEMGSDRIYVLYFEGAAAGVNTKTEGFASSPDGNFLWPGSFVTISNPTQEKLHLAVTSDVYKNVKLAWGDRRIDEGIYAQDINPSGQLGNPVTPVELISFTSSVSGTSVTLRWTTASETNNYGFEIERRINNKEWITIGFSEGMGTTVERTNYSYTDHSVAAGIYYYRLKQIDNDGQFSYSNETEVEIKIADKFILDQNYPNPFNPATQISFTLPENSFVKLKIFNLLGEEISSLINRSLEAGYHSFPFNGAALNSGVYFYRIDAEGKNGRSFSSVKKMIISK